MRLFCLLIALVFGACGDDSARPADGSTADGAADALSDALGSHDGSADGSSARGFPASGPWVSYYGAASGVDLARVASTFRIINIDVDPDTGNFSDADIRQLQAGGANKVISYMNVGACEMFRSYWPQCTAQLGPYDGYPDEAWMNVGDTGYQQLVLDTISARLAARGVDGFYMDNLEVVEHGTATTNGPCNAACSQGGLDLVRRLREKYPSLLLVMQNGTSDVTRLGMTGGVGYPTLLDGIAHEEVYAPSYDATAESELLAWKSLGLPLWIATEDYVGNCTNTSAAMTVYQRSRANGFSPYVSDASGGQQVICYWGF